MEELLSLKWNNHRSTFLHILGVLRDKQAYTDVTLACDGKFYNVHKLVLSTCSDYFSAMFDKTDKTCKSPIIVLKDIKCEDLESLLDYMYLGEVNVRQCDLASLIKSAECLRVKGLAVPDDEPPKKVPNRTESNRRDNVSESNRRDHVSGSPPPKRKRRDEGEDGRDDVRPMPIMHSSPISSSRPKSPISQRLSPSPHRTAQPSTASREERISHPFSSPTESHSQPVAATSNATANAESGEKSRTEENPSLVKVETIDCDDDDGPQEIQDDSFDMGNDSYKEEGDSGGGAGEFNSDLPEFLQAAASGSLGNYSHTSFPGPSNFQPGDISGWQGEGSSMGFPAHMNYTDGSSQQNAPGGKGSTISDVRGHLSSQASGQTALFSEVGVGASDNSGVDGRGTSCSQCGRFFLRMVDLIRHVRTHTGEKPFACPYCDFRSAQSGNVYRHIKKMHPELLQPYIANNYVLQGGVVSGRGQVRNSSIIQDLHVLEANELQQQQDSGKRQYPCHYCDKWFATPSKVVRHERTHTGERPYRCQHCSFSFNQREILKRHLKSVHKVPATEGDSEALNPNSPPHHNLQLYIDEAQNENNFTISAGSQNYQYQ